MILSVHDRYQLDVWMRQIECNVEMMLLIVCILFSFNELYSVDGFYSLNIVYTKRPLNASNQCEPIGNVSKNKTNEQKSPTEKNESLERSTTWCVSISKIMYMVNKSLFMQLHRMHTSDFHTIVMTMLTFSSI